MNYRITFILWLLLLPSLSADPIKKALKTYHQQKYETTEKLLRKTLGKDSLNPGAKYTYSLLYSHQGFPRFEIDSAHYFILASISNYQLLDEKQLARFSKIPLAETDLIKQSKFVDSLAFARAVLQDSLDAYLYFIEQYQEADQIPEAIERRNELAYQAAAAINTYHSYERFFVQYPNALQVPEAQKKYDHLLFLDKVGGGTAADYQRFITQYPFSPYRAEAETQVFEINTSDGLPSSFINYLHDHPESSSANKARNLLFHLVKDKRSDGSLHQEIWMNDSLQSVLSLDSLLLFPVYEKGLYGFAQQNGRGLIPPTYDSLDLKYLCGDIKNELLLVYKDQTPHWVTKTGAIFQAGDFDEITDIGYGFLKVRNDRRYGLVHKSREHLLDTLYQDIKLLKGRFIAFQQNGLWGLATLSGRVILEPAYQDIAYQGPVITLQKDALIAAVLPSELAASANHQPLSLNFEFEEIEWIDDHHLRGYYQDREALISDSLIIPLGPHQIYESYQGWYTKSDSGVRLYHANLSFDTLYADLISSYGWLGLKKDRRWQVFDTSLARVTTYQYDSAALLGNQMLYLTKGDSAFVLFTNGQLRLLQSEDKITLWPGQTGTDQGKVDDFLLISTKSRWREVYNNQGKRIYRTQYYDLRRLSPDYFEIEKNGQKGLVDRSGKIALEARYSALSSELGGEVSLLSRGKFGLFTGKLPVIKPQYQSKLQRLGNDLFLATKKGKKGLINSQNKTILPFEFDQIEPWNDSTVLVKEATHWQLYKLKEKEPEYPDIERFDWLKNTDEEKIIIAKTETGYAVVSNRNGTILAPNYDDIINLGNEDQPIYFTEKRVREAGYYVVIYYDQEGEILRKQVFDEKDYDKILCY